MYADKEKQRKATRERVRRYRERRSVTPKNVTPEQGVIDIQTLAAVDVACGDKLNHGVAPKIQHFNPMMVGYVPEPR